MCMIVRDHGNKWTRFEIKYEIFWGKFLSLGRTNKNFNFMTDQVSRRKTKVSQEFSVIVTWMSGD